MNSRSLLFFPWTKKKGISLQAPEQGALCCPESRTGFLYTEVIDFSKKSKSHLKIIIARMVKRHYFHTGDPTNTRSPCFTPPLVLSLCALTHLANKKTPNSLFTPCLFRSNALWLAALHDAKLHLFHYLLWDIPVFTYAFVILDNSSDTSLMRKTTFGVTLQYKIW
jgi:hypothetical protein